MAKKKKTKATVKVATKKPQNRATNDILCDTTQSPVMLDLSTHGQPIEGLLNLSTTYDTRDNITVSFRVPKDLLDWAKETAMKESLASGKEIHYQRLILGCFLDKYPLSKKD